MIDWDSIKDNQIELTNFFEDEFGILHYRISIPSLNVEIPVHFNFMKDDNRDFVYYLKNNYEVSLSKQEISLSFFQTLKKRVFRLYPELLL